MAPKKMISINIFLRGTIFKIGFLAPLLVVFLYLLIRNMGLYPVVFGDEWSYSSFSRLIPFKDVMIPNYLYFTVFRSTNYCGNAFLECARIINSLFFVGAAPFIFLIAKKMMTRTSASVIAFFSILGPANSFTAYFMPEAMYFFAFWVFSWTVFLIYDRPANRAVILSAGILGLISMVKVHAIFLLPSFCAFLAYVAYVRHAHLGTVAWIRKGIAFITIAILVAVLVRMTIGYLYAGEHGLNLFGDLYGGQAKGRPAMAILIPQALANLEGHLMALVLLFGMPAAAIVLHGTSGKARAESNHTAILVYTLLMLVALLAITVMFTAAVAGNGSESNARLHMRYYNFIFPLFLIVAASQMSGNLPKLSILVKLIITIPLAALIVYSNIRLLPAFSPNYIDSPELHGLTRNSNVFNMLTGLSLLVLAGWAVDIKHGAQMFIFLFMPVFTLAAGSQMNSVMRQATQPDAYVKAGIFAHNYLKKSEIDRLTIIGNDAGNIFKTRFFVDNPNVNVLVMPTGLPVDIKKLNKYEGWMLIIGDHSAPPGAISHLSERDFSLVQIVPSELRTHIIDFSKPESDDYLVRTVGLSDQESWGRWSNAKRVELKFAWPLPKDVTLRLVANAFGPNRDKEFVVSVGQQKKNVRLTETPQALALNFQTNGAENAITVDIPHPISPKELGLGTDARLLGIALFRVEVGPTDKTVDALAR